MSIPSSGVCPKCAGEVRDGWRVCPSCAAPLLAGNGARETETVFSEAPSSSSGIEEGRFPAGTVLAGRYRVLGLLGRGGMGEVYRAHDQILNQAVALKFLAGPRLNEAALARFRNEVRIARQVSHPNVCRVYDIGAVEGQHYLSMEYLDGEDLDSLIRRIGRLPQDKAIEFTRKICAGLAAAHERGILHRDLKPANIMIDGRGHVRIMDFGLAGLAAEIPLSDLRSGTPAYMSPEQKAGRDVTTRSDLYSLGLVLYEMFTGKRRTSEQSNPTEIVKDLDPAIERIILRCLEEEPRRRPSSALNVAMALPGADPIAAALAAGETPSPEMVAASGEKEGFSPRTAVACFVGILVLLAATTWIIGKLSLLSRAELATPPDGLAFRAQDILKQLGYTEQPKSTAYGFDCCDLDYLAILQSYDPARRDAILASQQPPVVRFWYRQHQGEIQADGFGHGGRITYDSPPNLEPGMIRLVLDGKGRLAALEGRPPAESDANAASKASDWNALFTAAGLDPARFSPVAARVVPPMAFDARMAWTGTYAEGRPEQIRLEAASWAGRPVYFSISGDWGQRASSSDSAGTFVLLFFLPVLIAIFVGGVLVAWRNLRLGRGDRRGAARLAGATSLLGMGGWIFSASHVPGPFEVALLIGAIGLTGLIASVVWCFYLAVEPYVRRFWPDALISWTRFQSGRLRDPLVASHILAGMLLSFGIEALDRILNGVFSGGKQILVPRVEILTSPAPLPEIITGGIIAAIGMVVFVVLMRLLVRRVWIADLLASLLLGGILVWPWVHRYPVERLYAAAAAWSILWLFRRFGLLALVTQSAVRWAVWTLPVSLTSWYAGRSLVVLAVPAVLAAWALWVILSAERRPGTESAG
jgi:predicted Ser/Thr protein kinase